MRTRHRILRSSDVEVQRTGPLDSISHALSIDLGAMYMTRFPESVRYDRR